MDALWDFLSNNSPKLICKPRSQTPCFLRENSSSQKSIPVNRPNRILQSHNKIPLKINIEKSLNQIHSKSKQNLQVFTSRLAVKSPIIARTQTSKKNQPLAGLKKFSPVLSSAKSLKTVKSVKK